MASMFARAAIGASRHSSLFAVGATVAATGAGAVGYASCDTTVTTTTVTTTTTTSGGAAPAAPGEKMMKQRGDKDFDLIMVRARATTCIAAAIPRRHPSAFAPARALSPKTPP